MLNTRDETNNFFIKIGVRKIISFTFETRIAVIIRGRKKIIVCSVEYHIFAHGYLKMFVMEL